jgi:hypothetical protein
MDTLIQSELLCFSVLDIICSLMAVVIEMDNAVRFASQLEKGHY